MKFTCEICHEAETTALDLYCAACIANANQADEKRQQQAEDDAEGSL